MIPLSNKKSTMSASVSPELGWKRPSRALGRRHVAFDIRVGSVCRTSLRTNVITKAPGSRHKNTLGWDRVGDLDRAALTSKPLGQRCDRLVEETFNKKSLPSRGIDSLFERSGRSRLAREEDAQQHGWMGVTSLDNLWTVGLVATMKVPGRVSSLWAARWVEGPFTFAWVPNVFRDCRTCLQRFATPEYIGTLGCPQSLRCPQRGEGLETEFRKALKCQRCRQCLVNPGSRGCLE